MLRDSSRNPPALAVGRFKALILVALLLSSSANAVEFSAGLGGSKFSTKDGIWYQSEFDHTINANSKSAMLRADYSIDDKYSLGAGYLYLGKVSIDAKASASDSDHSWPLSHWIGYGDVKGVFLTGKRRWESGWFIEGGAYAYRPTWQEYIPDWRACATCETKPVSVAHVPHTKLSPIYGGGYRHGPFTIEATQVWVNGDGPQFVKALKGNAIVEDFSAGYTDRTTSIFLIYTF
jgi:hypothetical protein